MKKKTLYTCEICHTDYADEAEAKQCEKEHEQIKGIKSFRVNAHEKYPCKIEVQFKDGKTCWYKQYSKVIYS